MSQSSFLNKDFIDKLLEDLSRELEKEGVKGEIVVVGGAAMILCFNARESTRDVDCIMKPTSLIKLAAKRVAQNHGINEDWMNDGVKGFISGSPDLIEVKSFKNLNILTPVPGYILAMKCISARIDSQDRNDVKFLINHLGLRKPEDVFKIIEEYFPRNRIPAKTIYFIEEILEEE